MRGRTNNRFFDFSFTGPGRFGIASINPGMILIWVVAWHINRLLLIFWTKLSFIFFKYYSLYNKKSNILNFPHFYLLTFLFNKLLFIKYDFFQIKSHKLH